MDLFSNRNKLIDINNSDDYNESFRIAIVNSFFDQYTSLEKSKLFYSLKEIMNVLGIEQTPSFNDEKMLLDNKEETIDYIKHCEWNRMFDFVELSLEVDETIRDNLSKKYNKVFAVHGCKYRIVEYKVLPIISEIEINEIKNSAHSALQPIDDSITGAVELMSNREVPDYNAVIAKASNALESMILIIAEQNSIKEETLGKAITNMKKKGVQFDIDLEEIIRKIYKYACNSGIRHGGTEQIKATEPEAIFVLTLCSSTINYLKRRYFVYQEDEGNE